MITAKPLKRRDLGRMAEPETMTKPRPSHGQVIINSRSIHNQIGTREKYGFDAKIIEPKEIREVIYNIIRDHVGIRPSDITKVFRKFLKEENLREENPMIDPNAHLRILLQEGRIEKMKVAKISWYFKRV